MNLRLTLMWCFCLLMVCGCTAVEPAAPFAQVREEVGFRTGLAVVWDSGSQADMQAHRQVQSLLDRPLEAEGAVQIALLRNRRLQARYQQLAISQAQLVQAGLLKNPVFSGSYRFTEGMDGRGTLELSLMQDFLDILLIPLRKRLAKADLQRAQAQVTGDVVDMVGQVRSAFYRLVAAEQLLDMWAQTVEAAELSYEMAKRLKDAGNIRDLDLADERAMYEQARLDQAAAELNVLQVREELNALMGLWGNQTQWTSIQQMPAMPSEEIDLSNLESRAVGQSLDLAAARLEIELAAARGGLRLAEQVWPALEAGAQAEREADGVWQLGPEVATAIPIFDQGQGTSAAARAEVRRQFEQYTALAIEVRADARIAFYRLVSLRRQADYYQTIMVPLRRQLRQLTHLQYNAMQIGVFQLLQAKRQEIRAQRQATIKLRDYWLANIEVQQILAGKRVRNLASFPGARDTPEPATSQENQDAQPPGE